MRFLRFNYKNKNKATNQPLYLKRVNKSRLLELSRQERRLYKQLKMSGIYEVAR